jgi:FdhD protein
MDVLETTTGAEKLPVVRITEGVRSDVEDLVVKEAPLTIVLDNQELVTMLCSPIDLKYLAIGYLFSEGFLRSKDEVKKVVVDDRKGIAWVETKEGKGVDAEVLSKRLITSGCGRGASFYSLADAQVGMRTESRFQMLARDVLALVG